MSGICGILRLDGGPPDGIAAMLDKLATRGPDGSRLWQAGPAALGHAALHATPESLHETLPLTHAESGCSITADLRLDNREELIAALALPARGRVVGDGEIVLHAYLRWGEDCPGHLLGDFAFVIHDARRCLMFGARDQTGMKQLIHAHVPGRVFAFASEPEAVIRAAGIPRRINEARIADFLEDYLEAVDYTSTFFEGVFRLPPAHRFMMTRDRFTVSRYWTLEPGPELELSGTSDHAEAFLDTFRQAVRARLRVAGPVGSMLSGGMDSGSVVAVAARELLADGRGPLHTFSCLGPDPEKCVETRTALAAIAGVPGLEPHLADYMRLGPYMDDLARLMRDVAEPFDAHMVLPRMAYLMARRAGLRVVLDGVGGDNVLSSSGRLTRLIRSGRWVTAWRESAGMAHYWRGRRQWFLRPAIRQAMVPDVARKIRRRWQDWREDDAPDGDLLCPVFASEVGLAARKRALRHLRPAALAPAAIARAGAITGTYEIVGRERYDRVASEQGIEPRDPFHDRRVIELALRLPDAQLGGGGWHKMILRQAMDGLLPDEVRWRQGKEHVGGRYIREVIGNHPITAPPPQLTRFLRPYPSADGPEERMAEGLRKGEIPLAAWISRLEGLVDLE